MSTKAARNAKSPRATNKSVDDALKAIPKSRRSDFHGKCGECDAVAKAKNSGVNVTGAVVTTTSVITGRGKKACSSCGAMMDAFGITYK